MMITLKSSETTEWLESKRSCVKTNAVSCLKFRYTFDINYGVDFSVKIEDDFYTSLWAMSSSVSRPGEGMDIAQVPLSETSAYNIYFFASRRDGYLHNNGSVYIDDVQIVESPCDQYPINSHPDLTDNCYPIESATCDFENSSFCSWYDFDLQ
jgi:hypothetical protein